MTSERKRLTALVTGGGGFLGRAIVERLLGRGDTVRIFSRGEYPGLSKQGVEVIRGDLADANAVDAACRGCDVVFHVAAKPGIGGTYADYYRPNVMGTENVIAGCKEQGVARLVYTSSPSAIFNENDMEGVDESAGYPNHFLAHYPKTKAIAEQKVLAANGHQLATIALRPHLIWGPRDNHLVPRIIARARTLRQIGPHNKKVDCIYIDNAADAHILACDKLGIRSPVAGKAYFISQGEPRGVWDLINAILAAADLPPITRRVPRSVAYAIGAGMEVAYRLLRLQGEPRLTRFVVQELSTAHWFDISAARRDLGYEPSVSIDEGMQRLAEWLRSRP